MLITIRSKHIVMSPVQHHSYHLILCRDIILCKHVSNSVFIILLHSCNADGKHIFTTCVHMKLI